MIEEIGEMGISPNTVVQGDCIKNLSKIAPGSVNLVFADPPFNIGYEYDIYNDQQSDGEYLEWSRNWMKSVHRCLAEDGSFWLAIGDEYAAELKLIAQQDAGFVCRTWVIWYYTFGVNCVRGFSRSHTHLFHFVKDPENFVFNGDNPAVRIPSARQLVYADGRANPKGRLPDNTWIYRPQDALHGFQPFTDTWYFARVAGTFKERQGFHGCQMPEQLLGRIIRVSSNTREVVLDPFSGSGTTLAVAKKLGRQWIGLELSEDYVRNIRLRLAGISPGDELDGPEDPIRSAPKTKKGRSSVRLSKGRPIPKANADTEKGIVEAFSSTSDGCSADVVLCDRDLNAAFVTRCRKMSLPGTAFVWNRFMLRLRKSGRLPKSTNPRRRITFRDMDAYSFASEIALHLLQIDYGLALDDILCSPAAAQELDQVAEKFAPGYSPFEYRWAALSIRKRAKTLKGLAQETYRNWGTKQLPKSRNISHVDLEKYKGSGVYILGSKDPSTNPLYVGEAIDIKSRLVCALQTEARHLWEKLGLATVAHIPAEAKVQLGLQSMIVAQKNPMLNTRLLVPPSPFTPPVVHDSGRRS